eukprot:CAMPEP_0203760566 /NCGR_PEP_ID=MMETSP0098-20131031/13830_1 /ASSEMBLY_ACC=CAM_ASM_000208 /TAXON_ID=96639 /ORGANISM=" , Strain NY0313808BC1" /LENGTH=2496 /DNA_ID=CAMNT_0050654185 /DNA_START=458 /DNA_END=7945 /DNA_ORIENTATION=-
MRRRRSVIVSPSLEEKNDERIGDSSKVDQLVQRRLIPGSDSMFCWGLHGGREWLIVGSANGMLSILSKGSAGPSNFKSSYALCETISLREAHDTKVISRVEKKVEQTGGINIWEITALAWCKVPSTKIGDHPLDSDAPYCGAFAVGSYGKVSVFYPVEKNGFEWEIVSVMEPVGLVNALSWAPEGHHLVSAGNQLVLWSPDVNAAQVHNSSACSVRSGESGGSISSSTLERNHQNLLSARSPMMAAVLARDDTQSVGSIDHSKKDSIFDVSWLMDCGELPCHLVDFSGDGRMFASASQGSSEVKVWSEGEGVFGNMDYISLYHPRAVLTLKWRRRAHGSYLHVKPVHSHTPQTLATLSRDQKVRIWQETDPQMEELSMFIVATLETERPCKSIDWLQFINYFEGLRSPYSEDCSYTEDREDFISGFENRSPFFHSAVHPCSVWGEHQKKLVELRTGPIVQETRSSIDWFVAMGVDGNVCVWSLEGLSDSPRRDIEVLPWVRSCSSQFQPNYETTISSPTCSFSQAESMYYSHSRIIQSESDETTENKVKEAGKYPLLEHDVFDPFIAVCRTTQEFDPHTERDPWPSTSVFDINPKNIEVLSLTERGILYSFVEAGSTDPDSPCGKVTHENFTLAKGHSSEITSMTSEVVIDLANNYSSLLESFWVTSVDTDGGAMAWPVRYGSADEEVDSDAFIRDACVPMPLQGDTKFACCSEIPDDSTFGLVAGIVSKNDPSFQLWSHHSTQGEGDATPFWVCWATPLKSVLGCTNIFVNRDSDSIITFSVVYDNGNTIDIFEVESRNDELDLQQLASHSGVKSTATCAVNDRELWSHGVKAIAVSSNGQCCLYGDNDGVICGKFQIDPVDRVKQVSNDASGKIITVHESNKICIWQPGLCHLQFSIEATIQPKHDVGHCRTLMANGQYLGSGVDIIAVGALEMRDSKEIPVVLLYSRSIGSFSMVGAGKSGAKYALVCSSRKALLGASVNGIAWAGRDFGLAVASGSVIHLFMGWYRLPTTSNTVKQLERTRKRMEFEGKSVASTVTMQLEATSSVGDTAIACQLPLGFFRPRTILELLRAGRVNPVRHILQALLRELVRRKNENEEKYGGEGDPPPPPAMIVLPPVIPLREVLSDFDTNGTDVNNGDSSSTTVSNFDTGTGANANDTADALFGNDFGYKSTPSAHPRGAASALFAEDPWASVLAKPTIDDSNEVSGIDSDSELSELLMLYQLQGMDSSEQLQLTAFAGVFDEIYGLDTEKKGFGDGVDASGARFMLAYNLYKVSTKCFSPTERPRSMSTADLVWALDSDCQDALVERCLPKGVSTWEDAKRIGVGLWLKSDIALKNLAEQLAQTQFKNSDRDPFSCSLFYFALGKHTVVSGLFKLAKNTKAAQLLANDFSDAKWKSVAIKNAFSLLRQKRFIEAASFFVLGGKLMEAANICVKNVCDYQLALVVAKLVEGPGGPVQENIWNHTVRALALQANDSWLESIRATNMGSAGEAVLAFIDNMEDFKTKSLENANSEQKEWIEKILPEKNRLDIIKDANVSAEALNKLEAESFPSLCTAFNTLEPIYIKEQLKDQTKATALFKVKRLGLTKRVLQESMQRAAAHFATIGIPLLALDQLASIDTGLCMSCVQEWRTRLTAQVFHPSVLTAHSNNSSTDDVAGLMVLSEKSIEDLECDLDTALSQIGGGNDESDILESLCRISRASNHIAIEFTLLRMLRDNKGRFLVRLQQVFRSVMACLLALSNSNIDAGISTDDKLLPARRLASYAVFLLDLSEGAGSVLSASSLETGDQARATQQLSLLLAAFARVALLCSAKTAKKLAIIKSVLGADVSTAKLKEQAASIATSSFNYEERFDGSMNDSAATKISSIEYEDDEDLHVWGVEYAKKLMDVIIVRTMIYFLMNKREHIQSLGPKKLDVDPVHAFCVKYIEELIHASWPLNWTLLSDLQVCRIPVGLSSIGADRLALMKERAFKDADYAMLWKFLKGKEQLRILDATAEWTSRSINQERAMTGYLPDPKVFCVENSKVIYSQPGSLVLSVDPLAAVGGCVVVASDRGTDVVRFSFSNDNELEGGSEDEDMGSSRTLLADEHEFATLAAETDSIQSPVLTKLKTRSRGRSSSDNELIQFTVTENLDPVGGISDENPRPNSSGAKTNDSESTIEKKSSSSHRFRRPHIRLKRNRRRRSKIDSGNSFSHVWSSNVRTLLMVSKSADRLWWSDELRMPLNRNLYGDSYHHTMSAHNRVKAVLRNGSGSVAVGIKKHGGRARLLQKLSKKGDTHSKRVMSVTSHPFLPYYVSGQFDGTAVLWNAGVDPKEPVTKLNKPTESTWKSGYTTRVRITEDGCRVAACDSTGQVLLWNLTDASDAEIDPFGKLNCHTKRALDVAFLNCNGSVFATAGQSHHSENLCIWDLSLPPRTARVFAAKCAVNSAAYSLAYLQDQQVILVGSGAGQLGVFDLRQRALILEEAHVHTKAVRSLAVHPSGGNYFASGSTDGTVKLW